MRPACSSDGLQDDRHYTEALNPLDPNLASNDSRYHSYRTDVQWNNTVHLSDLINVPALSATDLTFGYEYTADNINVKVNQSSFGSPFVQSAKASMTDDALYAGLQTTVLQRVTLTGQVRQDWVDSNAPFTWRLGAVLDVPEVATRFKAAYGTAFRAPSLFDRFGVDSFGYIGNPSLLPESAQGWEVGFTTTPIPAISFGATYFNEQIQQSDRRRIHARGYRGEHRLGAYPGCRDRAHVAPDDLALPAGQLHLYRRAERRHRLAPAAPTA